MKNPDRDIIDHLTRALEDPSYELPAREAARLNRLKAIYAHLMEHPLLTESMVRDWVMTVFHIGRAQAYNDIAVVKVIFGTVSKADKEYQRWRANKLLEMAAAAALAGNDRKAKALTKVADSIVKANNLDEAEGEDYPFDEIVPKDESFSVDPATIGIEKVPGIEEKARKLLLKYNQEIDADD